MISRRVFSAALTAIAALPLVALGRRADALDWPAFAWEPFEAAHAEAIPVVVTVHAKGCETCETQDVALAEVLAEPTFEMFKRFRVDFDTQRDVLEKLHVAEKATILTYICNDEIGRVVGETTPAVLRRLFEKTQIA